MGFHHVALFVTIAFLWYILVSAEPSLEDEMPSSNARQLYIRQPSSRGLKKISQRAFKDMELYTARGYGKRSNCEGDKFCGKRMPKFSGARLYGKRNIDVNDRLKCLFVDCLELERNFYMDLPSTSKFRRDEEVVLPD